MEMQAKSQQVFERDFIANLHERRLFLTTRLGECAVQATAESDWQRSVKAAEFRTPPAMGPQTFLRPRGSVACPPLSGS